MRSGFAVMLMVTILFGGGYFYYIAQAVCPVPIAYSIGEIDDRFGLTEDDVKLFVSEAADVWENATDRNLFQYDDESSFTINFIYDERQAFAVAEDAFKNKLDAAENINDAISDTYAKLVADYNDLKITYADEVESYERRLNNYNETVSKYNDEGGAPKNVYEELQEEKEALDTERANLNSLAKQLNGLVNEINNISEKGNNLIETYNEGVQKYNESFGESREFTQGDYQGDRINIYTYEDEVELQLVLVHELGHALSLGHVAGEESVMYYLIGEQPSEVVLSEADLAEFNYVCGSMSIWDKIVWRLQNN